jgi:predicted PurR-regulated permease PerM
MAARPAATPSGVTALWIIAVLLLLFFLQSARTLLIPIALAVLISYALMPAVTWLEKRRLPRLAGAALVLLAVTALCGAGLYALKDDAKEVARAVPEAAERARETARTRLGADIGDLLGVGGVGSSSSGDGSTRSDNGAKPAGESKPAAGGVVQKGVGAVVALAGHLVVVFFLIYFILISGPRVRDRVIEISGPDPDARRTASAIIDDINTQVQRYLLVLLVTAAVVATATWIALAWMGVRQAAMWGILAGIFNSIPYFGPVIVSGGLFVVGMVQGGSATGALQLAGAAIVITSLEGWLLTPALMGKAERMSALAVFLGLLLWTWTWGAWGTVLAVPMLVVIKSVCDHVDRLKPIGRLMAP